MSLVVSKKMSLMIRSKILVCKETNMTFFINDCEKLLTEIFTTISEEIAGDDDFGKTRIFRTIVEAFDNEGCEELNECYGIDEILDEVLDDLLDNRKFSDDC